MIKISISDDSNKFSFPEIHQILCSRLFRDDPRLCNNLDFKGKDQDKQIYFQLNRIYPCRYYQLHTEQKLDFSKQE